MERTPRHRLAKPQRERPEQARLDQARPEPAWPGPGQERPEPRRTAETTPDEVRSFDALWSDGHWEHRPDPDSLRSWLGLAPTATLTDLPPIREEAPAPDREPKTQPSVRRTRKPKTPPSPPPTGESQNRPTPEPETQPSRGHETQPIRERQVRPTPEHGTQPIRDERDTAGRRERPAMARAYFTAAFWVLLTASLILWWLNTPARSIATTGDVLLAAGRITGLAGGFVLLFQILLMSRATWLERWIGAHSILVWHRELGGYLFFAILTHAVTTVVAYSRLGDRPVLGEAWDMVTGWDDMLTATAATVVLAGIVVVSIRGVRRKMSYETWYYIHLGSYLIVVLGYAHQFSNGQELNSGVGRWYWIGLHGFVVGNLVWGRAVGPLLLNLRHRLRVVDVVSEAPGIVSLYIGGRRLPDLKVRAGQYFRWRFLAPGSWWQAHPFSLSAAPNHDWLRLTVKVIGDHTSALAQLTPGTRVVAEGPSGVFTADRSVKRSALLIAGGSGIAPIRALLEDLPPGTILIYRATTVEDIVFRRELDWLAHERRAYVWYVVGRRDDPGPRQLFSPQGMHKLVPDVAERDVFLCGPPGLVEESMRTLRRLRVRKRQIHIDPFEF